MTAFACSVEVAHARATKLPQNAKLLSATPLVEVARSLEEAATLPQGGEGVKCVQAAVPSREEARLLEPDQLQE